MKITKALIIDEPWLSKILAGDKVWEMRSTKSNFRGLFGLIRKGSGQVIGVANLKSVSGPYCDDDLAKHFGHHRVGNDVVSKPGYKWRYAWELSNIRTLLEPVPYVHKNGAVTWVELNDDAVEKIDEQIEGCSSLTGPSIVNLSVAESLASTPVSLDEGWSMVPQSKDGSIFTVESCNNKGLYTVGEKGDEQKFRNYGEALNYLKSMTSAKWRRPNSNGNWGIVTATDWVTLG